MPFVTAEQDAVEALHQVVDARRGPGGRDDETHGLDGRRMGIRADRPNILMTQINGAQVTPHWTL